LGLRATHSQPLKKQHFESKLIDFTNLQRRCFVIQLKRGMLRISAAVVQCMFVNWQVTPQEISDGLQ
jgi:hypothetical protein